MEAVMKLCLLAMVMSSSIVSYPLYKYIYLEVPENTMKIREDRCNRDRMILVKENGMMYCRCQDGYYLSFRDANNPNTHYCLKCKKCIFDVMNPYEIQACRKNTNTVCCPKPDMIARKSRFGYQNCLPLSENSAKDEAISGSVNCLTELNMEPYTKDDGTSGCRCKKGYFTKRRNVIDRSMDVCIPINEEMSDSQNFDSTSVRLNHCRTQLNKEPYTTEDGTFGCRCKKGYVTKQRNIHDRSVDVCIPIEEEPNDSHNFDSTNARPKNCERELNKEPYTKDDGTSGCRCKKGYFTKRRSVIDRSVDVCIPIEEEPNDNQNIDSTSVRYENCLTEQNKESYTKDDGTTGCRCKKGYVTRQRNMHDSSDNTCVPIHIEPDNSDSPATTNPLPPTGSNPEDKSSVEFGK